MPHQRPSVSRRGFLAVAASAAGGLAVGCVDRTVAGPALAPLPGAAARKRPRIEHVIVVMMENRSFDHLLGWLPRADGRQRRLTYLDAGGAPHETYALAP